MSNLRLALALPLVLLITACTHYRTIDAPDLSRGERRLAYEQRVQLFRLSNGMLVALVPERGTNLVKVDMRYTLGAAEDPAGKSGMAHLVEHLMFTVRRTESGPSIADTLGKNSLHSNAYTTWDETHYTATALSNHLTTLVEAEHLRMTAACTSISDAVFQRERQVVIQEILQRHAANGPAASKIRAKLFGTEHAYLRDVGGTPKQVSNITKQEACAFIRTHYMPARAILVVSGHFNGARLRGLVGGLFGAIPRRATAELGNVADLAKPAAATVEVDVDSEQAGVMVAFSAPRWGSSDHTAHRMLADVLLGELRRRTADVDDISGITFEHIGGYRGGADAFVLWFNKAPSEATARTLFKAARKQAFSFFDDHTVTRLINREHLTLLGHAEPFATRAMLVADYLQYTYGRQLMAGELRRVTHATADEMSKAAKYSFRFEDARLVVLQRKKSGEAMHDRVPVSVATKEFDFDVWREPVDAAEALRPIPIPKAAARPKVFEHTYDNGLHVVLVPKLSHPVVDVRLVLPVGSDRDPSGKKGLGALAASLLSTSTNGRVPPRHLRTLRFVDSLGSLLYSQVSEQTTTFRGQGLSSNIDSLLWQLQQWLKRGAYDKGQLARFRKRIADRRVSKRQRILRRLSHMLGEAVYGKGHPYVPTLRHRRSLGVSLSDLRAHRRAYYGLRGATLIVAGRFDARDVAARIKRLFGTMPGGPRRTAAKPIPVARPQKGPTFVSLVDDTAQQPAVLFAFPTAPGVTSNRAARRVLVEILRQRMTQIRGRYGATYGINVGQSRRRGPGALFITGHLDPNRGDKALLAMATVLTELRQGKDLARDFVRARRRVFAELLATTSDSATVAASLRFAATHHLPNDHRFRLARAVARIKPSAVRALIASELSPDRTFAVVSGSRAMLDKIYRTAGVTPTREVR